MLMSRWAEEQNRPKHITNILQKDPGLQSLNSGGKFGSFLVCLSNDIVYARNLIIAENDFCG